MPVYNQNFVIFLIHHLQQVVGTVEQIFTGNKGTVNKHIAENSKAIVLRACQCGVQ